MPLAVLMSPEVEEALGSQMAQQVRSITEGTCIECRQPLDAGPVNVVLAIGPLGSGSVRLVHDRCAPSAVVELTAEAEAAVIQPKGGLDMTMTAVMVEGAPALIARMVMTPYTDPGSGAAPTNVFMQALVESGFRLVTAGLDAAPLDQWIAVFQHHGRSLQLIILTPTAERFFHGTVARPPVGWIKAVLGRRRVLLLGGDVAGSHDDDQDQQLALLAGAAVRGQLVGARVAAGRPADFGLS
ncbi:hypothetical protein [Streptomyces sp. AM6-12]|uniref:hypothetical protein n=1 Tax=Streptomyces sp. AM6-12 TaxID=3345149 RepID=UPI0037B461C6